MPSLLGHFLAGRNMSTRFTLWCETHEIPGPHIRCQFFKQGLRGILQEEDVPRFFGQHDEDLASEAWGQFLLEHEWCEVFIEREFSRRLRPPEPEPPGPTHELMPDGSLRPL